MTCAPSEDSDQPGHPPSLIRVFAVRLIGSQGPKPSSSRQRNSDQTGRTCNFVGFVTMRLKFESFQCANMAVVYRCKGAGLVDGRANDCCSCNRCGMGGVLSCFICWSILHVPFPIIILCVSCMTARRDQNMSRDMTKSTQRRLRSAWASAQSDLSSLCA